MSYTRRRVVGKRRTALPEWRNRQTQQTQNLPLFGACRFKSGLGHQQPTANSQPFDMRQTLLFSLLLAATSAFALPPENGERNITHFILVPQHALQPDEIADLQAKGVTIGRTLGANRYMARVRDLDAVADDLRIRSLQPFDATRKIARSAYAQAATASAFGAFRVVFHDEVTLEEARAAIEAAGGSDPSPMATTWRLPNTIAALVPVGALQTLASD